MKTAEVGLVRYVDPDSSGLAILVDLLVHFPVVRRGKAKGISIDFALLVGAFLESDLAFGGQMFERPDGLSGYNRELGPLREKSSTLRKATPPPPTTRQRRPRKLNITGYISK